MTERKRNHWDDEVVPLRMLTPEEEAEFLKTVPWYKMGPARVPRGWIFEGRILTEDEARQMFIDMGIEVPKSLRKE